MPQFRRQLSLLLSSLQCGIIDAVRAHLYLLQHTIIGAHTTFCLDTEITNWPQTLKIYIKQINGGVWRVVARY